MSDVNDIAPIMEEYNLQVGGFPKFSSLDYTGSKGSRGGEAMGKGRWGRQQKGIGEQWEEQGA